jgi:hypothetical protein
MSRQEAPHITQGSVEALRHTAAFVQWTRDFERLKRDIGRRISPRDIQPLLNAGATEDGVLAQLAFVVHDSDKSLSELIRKRQALRSLAAQLSTVTVHATRLLNDPCCDGRFWLAAEGFLSWDIVPRAGAVQGAVLNKMKELAQLVDERGRALGQLSRQLKTLVRNRGVRDLLAYVALHTRDKDLNLDREIAELLMAAFRAAGKKKDFTADQIKKFRQRHLRASPKAVVGDLELKSEP